jgi:hemoglobin
MRWLLFTAVALAAAAPGAVAQTMAEGEVQPTEVFRKIDDPQVFRDFGELPGLRRIMDDFMVNLLADPRTRPFFEPVDQQRVKDQLVEQFCDIMQGGCVYQGATMKDIHAGRDINRANFFALVVALQLAMNKHKVPFRSQNRLLAVLAPMHRDIVTR